MTGLIKKLGAQFFTIQNDSLSEVIRFGSDAAGALVFEPAFTSAVRFKCARFFDGDLTKPRSVIRSSDAVLERLSDGRFQIAMILPFPAILFPEIPEFKGVPDFLAQIMFTITPSQPFAADGSLLIQEYQTEYASWSPGGTQSGDAPPQDAAHYVDSAGNPKAISLKELTDKSTVRSVELDMFGSNASRTIDSTHYPLLDRCFSDRTNLEFKDRIVVQPQHAPGEFNFDKPRGVGIKPVGIRPFAQTATSSSLGFSAIVGLGASTAGEAKADLLLDGEFRADGLVIDGHVDVEMVQDVNNDPYLSPSASGTADTNEFYWYMRVRSVPVTAFSTIWNERIAKPYLDALRTTDDASDLSFVPLIGNIQPLGAGDKLPAFELLFDVVQQLKGRNRSEIADPVLIGFRPDAASKVEFAAEAVFPGLITHANTAVRRRLKITIERQRLEESFEWFDIQRTKAAAKPEITIAIETDERLTQDAAGGKVRIGALDLDVPDGFNPQTAGRSDDDQGRIKVRYNVTFDSADPTRASRSSAERDPKGRPGRARLPRHGEAIPRIAARIDHFDLTGVLPGSQDPIPDAGQAFDAVIEELARAISGGATDPNDRPIRREQRIAGDLQRAAPIVIVDGNVAQPPVTAQIDTPFFLRGEEVTANNRNRRLSLTLQRRATKAKAASYRTIVIDPEPMTVALVDVPAFELESDDVAENDGEIANWQTSELEGSKWEIARISDGFDLFLPPQATGEAAEKGAPWPAVSPEGAGARTLDYRLGTTARLNLRSSYFKQRYAEAPWNLRRVLGFAGQRAPGAGLNTARFEFLYGLASRFTAGSLRLAELGSRIGGIRDPLPARPRGITRSLLDETETKKTLVSEQPLVEAELYDRFRSVSASFTKAWGTRIALFETYREGSDEPLALEAKVAFTLRVKPKAGDPAADMDQQPWKPDSKSAGLRGGATWGFESRNIYDEVIEADSSMPPVSTRGQIVNPAFSALGGSGFVRAFFANGKTRIVSDTSFGRTHTYAVERIGRIGVFWNVAKHVIVYQRTVLPPDQFASQQAGQHFGRPVLRKVQEYVDILQPERAYPEKGAAPKTRGFVEACLFRTRRIPVDSRWGHDVPDGWIVPLWKEGEDPDIYPKPDIRLQLTAAQTDAAATIPGRFGNPSQLVFFTSTRKQDGDDPNIWPPRPDIDFINVPHPAPVGEPDMDPTTPDGKAPDDIMRDTLLGRCTFDIDCANAATNLVTERTKAEPIGAVLETVTMMRSGPTNTAGGPPAQALSLRRELEGILGDARRLEGVLGEALSIGRTALGNLLSVAGKSKEDIEEALNTEIDRLGEIKARVHREAATVRKTIAQAVDRAKANLDGAKSGWTDASKEVQARLKMEIQKALLSRIDTLSRELDAVSGRLDEFLDGVNADQAEVLANRIEETLAPVRLTIFSAINRVGDGLARLDQSIKTLRRDIDDAHAAVKRDAAELKSRIPDVDWRSLVTLYEEYHARAIEALDAADRLARRDLPKAIKDSKLFAVKAETVTEFLTRIRRKLDETHRLTVADMTKLGATIEQARAAVVTAVDCAVAEIGVVAVDMQNLTDEGARLAAAADAALAEFGSGFEARYDGAVTEIHRLCRDAASGIPAIKGQVEAQLNTLGQIAVSLRAKVDQGASDVLAVVGNMLDEVGVSIDQQELKLRTALDEAANGANVTLGDLETKLVDAIDGAIGKLEGNAGQLAAAIADASAALRKGADDIVHGLRDRIPPGLADDIRVLEQGYKRLANAPSFQNPSDTLALIRAAGSSPLLPNLKFNRDRIAYFFDDARDAVKSSPVVGLMNRLGDDLKALGIRVPTGEFLERLIPKELEKYDFGKLFPDLGGLKLDNLFKNIRLPVLNDKVKVTHGFDKASLTAWAKAEAKAPFPKRAEIFEFGPLKLSAVDAGFDALADIVVGLDGVMKRTTKAEVIGDWELAFSGQPLVTLERTRVFFENGGGLNVDIDPSRVRFDKAIKFLSDLIKSFSDPNSGFFLEMLEDNGTPSGLAARIELPMPPLSFGAFSITGLRFSSSFELLLIKGSGGKRGDFALGVTLALGLKKEPFILRVWILVGGGWLETRAKYFPSTGKLTSAVSIGLTAGLGLDFAFGPCRGFVFVMVGAYVEFESGSGNSFSIAVIFMVRGGIVILGRFNIGLYLLLELIYQDDGSLIGRGTIEVSFKICWCCQIKVRQGVTYYLRKGSGSSASMASAAPAHHLDNFA
ncbi:hypothetical protein [Bradyrhizobium sp. SZCCHNS3053]|uniref:hypothetical protein n=1 Tax=Bradyrhizobium sp. SZCCHNS3053 TaxID=3057322 RepID=UPI0029168014|nr:hypothetical protein [Bradyrhizobium sp. SZCCHNS3053]